MRCEGKRHIFRLKSKRREADWTPEGGLRVICEMGLVLVLVAAMVVVTE